MDCTRTVALFRAARLTGLTLLLTASASLAQPAGPAGDPYAELKVKRESTFEFVGEPAVSLDGDRVKIQFASKANCDATVAIEDGNGRIIRHLASGVLGANAPSPFQKNSLSQTLYWDGKNDQGSYVKQIGQHTVRVSLGLRPRLERSLYWSPYKRFGIMPLLAAGPDGVYVADGKGVDHIRLFDHDGEYVKSVYPFPAAKLSEIDGLNWFDFPQGYRLPRKGGLYQATLLSSGENWNTGSHAIARNAMAGTAMALQGDRLALLSCYLNRLTVDSTTGGLPLRGPRTGFATVSVADRSEFEVGPSSAAFSPDGKTLYLTGYLWRSGSWQRVPGCKHIVYKLDYEKGDKIEPFLGHETEHGSGPDRFTVPTSVATDAAGRVYVSDFLNDRVAVFDASGKHIKDIAAIKPAKVTIHRKTGEIWVFSYPVMGVPYDLHKKYRFAPEGLEHTVTRFSAMPEAKQISRELFPLGPSDSSGFEATGHVYHVELDSWAAEPTVWVVGRKHIAKAGEFGFSGNYNKNDIDPSLWKAGVRVQRRINDKWEVIRAFGDATEEQVVRAMSPRHNVQRLIVNPISGRLYVAEPDSGPTMKASNSWLEIDPATGRIRVIDLPFNAMEGAFDLDGLVYLRNTDTIARYQFPTWREVPWDYGEEQDRLGNDGGINGKTTRVQGGLKMPSTSPVCYHQGGFYVAPNGSVIASCAYRYVGISSGRLAGKDVHPVDVYKPQVYPGRVVNSTSPCLHVWDRHGQLKYEDALPGVGQCDGVAIDRDDNIYVMQAPSRAYDGKRYFNEMSETLTKVRPNAAKVISTDGSPLALDAGSAPKRQPDLQSTRHGRAWIDNAQWMYGGVGFAGFNMIGHGGGCACWFSRFTLDYFARSIAPEPHQYRVAVLDSAGNLILRIGQYGNVEDGQPLVADGGPKTTRSIGGDEVSLVHPCFVGTHTDRRIFISDLGNARIVSVKLDYHANRSLPLSSLGANN